MEEITLTDEQKERILEVFRSLHSRPEKLNVKRGDVIQFRDDIRGHLLFPYIDGIAIVTDVGEFGRLSDERTTMLFNISADIKVYTLDHAGKGVEFVLPSEYFRLIMTGAEVVSMRGAQSPEPPAELFRAEGGALDPLNLSGEDRRTLIPDEQIPGDPSLTDPASGD